MFSTQLLARDVSHLDWMELSRLHRRRPWLLDLIVSASSSSLNFFLHSTLCFPIHQAVVAAPRSPSDRGPTRRNPIPSKGIPIVYVAYSAPSVRYVLTLSRYFFHSAATPTSILVPVHLRHQILLSFLPLFFPYGALGLNPECFSWCYWYRSTRKQRPAARGKRSREGKRFGPFQDPSNLFANPWFLG